MERRRRVAVTVEQCWHRVPGGTATSTLALVDALARRDDVEIIGVAARHRQAPPEPFVPSVPVGQLPLPRRILYETWHGAGWPMVERATGPVDVVHGTAVAVPPTRAPLVMTVHDLAFLADPTQATRHGNRFFGRGTDLTRQRAARVIVPSEATAAECIDAGFDSTILRVVPWGVTPRSVTEHDVANVRRRHGLDRPYVLFVGTIEPRKNLAGVVAAMARLDGRGIDLALVGPDGWNEDLKARLAPLEGTSVRVRRLGFVPDADLAPLYSACVTFCYPSLREGFGLPVLDAMAHGAPVITSAGTATAEVVAEAGLLVDPTDHVAIGEALVSLVDDTDLADRLRTAGRQRAAGFSWDRTAEMTAAVYAEVAP